jgi:glutamine amidotransferase
MQMLCKNSEEGLSDGLSLIDANVKKIKPSDPREYKVPHMGWNYVKPSRPNVLLPEDCGMQKFYFVHSYIVAPSTPEIATGLCNYDLDFCASFEQNNVFGVQFHPEKSHRYGMALIQRFVEA